MFGTFARFAPIEIRTGPQRGMWLRPFGAGLLDSGSVSSSMMAFVLLLLATVLYDGALGTPEWGRLEGRLLLISPRSGDFRLVAIRTVGLIVFWLMFFGAYVGVCAIMSAVTARRLSPLAMARSFAFTLVPIAIGYHVAHYFTFLLIQGQYIIPLASDPFGFGWNLFGTAGYRVDIAIVDARVCLVRRRWRRSSSDTSRRSIWRMSRRCRYSTCARRVALAGPADRADGGLHLRQPLHSRRADRGAPRAGAARRRLQPRSPSRRMRCCRSREAADCSAVGAGKIARQKLTYRVLGSAFHDGTRTSAADLLYSYMFAYRWGARSDGDDARSDPLVAAATAVMRAQLLGVRVVGDRHAPRNPSASAISNSSASCSSSRSTRRSPPIDPEQDAAVAPPWSTLPWHLLVLMEEAVERGWAAFSQAEARRRGVDWLDLVRSEAMSRRLAALVETFEREGYRPDRLTSLVSAEDARKRWAALKTFYSERGHFLVTNGPYRLKRWSADSVTLEAFRDLSYPLGVGSYDAYAVPRRGFITKVERDGDRVRLSGDIELIQRHMRSYDIVRRPLPSIAADVLKRVGAGMPLCRDRWRRPRRAGGPSRARRGCELPPRSHRQAAGGQLHAGRPDHRQRQCDERR